MNSPPRSRHSSYTARMSATRMLRKLLVRLGSGGVSRMTSGLSVVGPPPALMMIHEFASWTIDGSPVMTVSPPSTSV
jgi:hypothetical protein